MTTAKPIPAVSFHTARTGVSAKAKSGPITARPAQPAEAEGPKVCSILDPDCEACQ